MLRLGTSSKKEDDKEPKSQEKWAEFHTYLRNCKVILVLYDEILANDPSVEFNGEFYKRMCSQSVVVTAIELATTGAWIALDVLFTKVTV